MGSLWMILYFDVNRYNRSMKRLKLNLLLCLGTSQSLQWVSGVDTLYHRKPTFDASVLIKRPIRRNRPYLKNDKPSEQEQLIKPKNDGSSSHTPTETA